MSIAFINIEKCEVGFFIDNPPEILELTDIYDCVKQAIETFKMAAPESPCQKILPVIHLEQ